MTTPNKKETLGFQAEVRELLKLMIHSLYSHKEIFLRELISNASDANDKLRFESLSNPALMAGDTELAIWIEADTAKGTLTLRDNGIGMSRDEVISNLGTIARSGTSAFVKNLSGDARKDAQLIGQFGVGFYSAFMVATEVLVISRRAGEEHAWRWRSDGRSGFTIEPMEEAAPRGTAVILKLRDDAKEFLDAYRLRQIVRSYSDHIAVPILLQGAAPDAKEAADAKESKEPEQINQASALWTRPKADISDEQYKEFYHHVAHAFDEPFARVHFAAEGTLSYTALLFVPSTRPFDLHDPKRRHGVKLYVHRVFITADLDTLMPRYLRFVSGVVDSEDLQLNVSRETLQHGAVVARMRKALVRRVLEELAAKSKPIAAKGEGESVQPESYDQWWGQFGAVLKEGLYEDADNRAKLLELARFRSTRGPGWTSLADYVARMKEGQEAILYISGESHTALRTSPQLEQALAKGVEVLLLDDPVDEFWLQEVQDYQTHSLRSLTRGDVDLSEVKGDPEAATEGQALGETELKRLIARLKASLGEDVTDIRASRRLKDSVVCLVAEDHGMDLRLERFLKQHSQLDKLSKRVLEINGQHELTRRMAAMATDEASGIQFDELARLLLDQARIVEGEPIPDPGAFSRRMSTFLAKGIAA